jgi:hypothetical protein
MFGPAIIARSLSVEAPTDKKYGNLWQYHSRSDRHSQITCWAILLDLLLHCRPLVEHMRKGVVAFGVNHTMRDFKTNKKKNLDLVICTPGTARKANKTTFHGLAKKHAIMLTEEERAAFESFPDFGETPVGEVHAALEAKATMTAHSRACPRLHDELSSSHLTVHGSNNYAIAAAFAMVNISDSFVSTDLNKFRKGERPPIVNLHNQPEDTVKVIQAITEIQRRSDTSERGFDAMGLVVVRLANDGTPVEVATDPPAPQPGDLLHYDGMIRKIAHLYQSRFPHE